MTVPRESRRLSIPPWFIGSKPRRTWWHGADCFPPPLRMPPRPSSFCPPDRRGARSASSRSRSRLRSGLEFHRGHPGRSHLDEAQRAGGVSGAVDLLEGVFLIRRLPPFFRNIRKRLVRSQRIYIRDTGLLHHLLHISTPQNWKTIRFAARVGRALPSRTSSGANDSSTLHQFYFWRTATGQEADLVLDRGETASPSKSKPTAAPIPTMPASSKRPRRIGADPDGSSASVASLPPSLRASDQSHSTSTPTGCREMPPAARRRQGRRGGHLRVGDPALPGSGAGRPGQPRLGVRRPTGWHGSRPGCRKTGPAFQTTEGNPVHPFPSSACFPPGKPNGKAPEGPAAAEIPFAGRSGPVPKRDSSRRQGHCKRG